MQNAQLFGRTKPFFFYCGSITKVIQLSKFMPSNLFTLIVPTNCTVANLLQRFLFTSVKKRKRNITTSIYMCLGSYYVCCLNSNRFAHLFFFLFSSFSVPLFSYPIFFFLKQNGNADYCNDK